VYTVFKEILDRVRLGQVEYYLTRSNLYTRTSVRVYTVFFILNSCNDSKRQTYGLTTVTYYSCAYTERIWPTRANPDTILLYGGDMAVRIVGDERNEDVNGKPERT